MSQLNIALHAQASDFLFKYFRSISKIFADVLGLLEIDYMSIALLTIQDELLFFSSRPSVEWKMIEHGLWLSDERFQQDFFMQEEPQFWSNQNRPPEFSVALSIPSVFSTYRVIYTFASKSTNKADQIMISQNLAMLTRIGQFALGKILAIVHISNTPYEHTQYRPKLKLIINHKDPDENIT